MRSHLSVIDVRRSIGSGHLCLRGMYDTDQLPQQVMRSNKTTRKELNEPVGVRYDFQGSGRCQKKRGESSPPTS